MRRDVGNTHTWCRGSHVTDAPQLGAHPDQSAVGAAGLACECASPQGPTMAAAGWRCVAAVDVFLCAGAVWVGGKLVRGCLFCYPTLHTGGFRCGCNNSAMFADIVPEHMRSKIYAFDRAFEGAVGACGLPLVGLTAQRLFGYVRMPCVHDAPPHVGGTGFRGIWVS